MKVIIIDDEHLARKNINDFLKERYDNLLVVAESESVEEGVAKINKHSPDLVFLDIDLTDGTGFDLLNSFEKINFKIIFVTAHNEFAIEAIKFSALDYVLKPIDFIELENAVSKAMIEYSKTESYKRKIDAFIHNSDFKNERKIVLNTSDRMYIVDISDIVRCESQNNYTKFFLKDKKEIMVSKSIKTYSDMLFDYGFFRVHRSHIVNMKEVEYYDKKGDGFLVLNQGVKIPISFRHKQKITEMLLFYNNI